tara:strand:+ start:1524 stop:1733 length:210 start_codon:yes stop_codon:yes gene_type:complete
MIYEYQYRNKLRGMSWLQLTQEEEKLRADRKLASKMQGYRGVMIRDVIKRKLDLVIQQQNNFTNQPTTP